MKPRPFTLTRLLEVRRMRQRRQELSLAAAVRALEQQEEVVESILAKQRKAREELRAMLRPPAHIGRTQRVPVREVMRYRSYLAALAEEAGQAAQPLEQLRRRATEQREQLADSRRDVLVLEKLRDRCNRVLRKFLQRRQQQQIDEIANRQYLARKNLQKEGTEG